eukprot:343377-Prymnesium_polylepis.1
MQHHLLRGWCGSRVSTLDTRGSTRAHARKEPRCSYSIYFLRFVTVSHIYTEAPRGSSHARPRVKRARHKHATRDAHHASPHSDQITAPRPPSTSGSAAVATRSEINIMQRDHGPRLLLGPGASSVRRIGRHRARGDPAEERLALVVAVSDDG